MTNDERKILEFLAKIWSPEDPQFVPFWVICEETALARDRVRFCCRRLARAGLAQFARGLWSEDGPRGAGYAATQSGRDALAAVEGATITAARHAALARELAR